LIELVVVVILISVFAALAIPQVTRQLRDRRVHEAAQRIAYLYRLAKLRAAGQGGAVNVQYGPGTNGQGAFTVLDALVGVPPGGEARCTIMPSSSCTGTVWENTALDGTGTARQVSTFDLGQTAGLDHVRAEMFRNTDAAETSGTSVGTLEICFTPLGRTFVRTGPVVVWQPLNEVPAVRVFREAEGVGRLGLTREVLLLPSGAARLTL
jgi:type II secretory pathway pseudopilin PulG